MPPEERIVAPALAGEDTGEMSLRPRLLSDFPGQDRVKRNIAIAIEAARKR